MAGKSQYLTSAGRDKLMKELKQLKGVRRRELSAEIEAARALGDIRENAEYHAAKEAQALNEKRIAELEEKITGSQVLDDDRISKDEALLGATVKLKDLDSSEECEYTLVSEAEADYEQGKISVDSPIGKGLLGHKKGQTATITVPAGTLRYKVLKISRQ